MDQMLPSPGFSIPSIGTPLHQPEEDQQILPHAQQQQQQQPPPPPTSLQQMPILSTPQKTVHTYAPSGFTPQSLMQPQTPVSLPSTDFIVFWLIVPRLLTEFWDRTSWSSG
jgi:transcription initiation factor TFIID TATA-box-binding protein